METVYARIRSDRQSGKLSHAILLDGGSPEQRLTLAKRIAGMLVCSSPEPPCGVCSHCVKADAGMHPDIFLFSGGDTVGSFKVDVVREIRQKALILPNEAAKKVFILDNAQGMNAAAQNALLKILEEPPAFVVFILTCGSASQLLGTVRSRVTLYSLPDTGSRADDAQQQKARRIAGQILSAVSVRREADVLRETAVFEKDKDLFRLCCMQIVQIASDALKAKLADVSVPDDAAALAAQTSREELYALVQTANETMQYMASNINGTLLLTWFSAQLCAGSNGRTAAIWQQ